MLIHQRVNYNDSKFRCFHPFSQTSGFQVVVQVQRSAFSKVDTLPPISVASHAPKKYADSTRWGPQSIAFSCRTFQWLNGRYNKLVNRGYFMVYKPTYNWGAPSCRTTLPRQWTIFPVCFWGLYNWLLGSSGSESDEQTPERLARWPTVDAPKQHVALLCLSLAGE